MTARKFVQSDLDSLCKILCDPVCMTYYPSVLDREGAQVWLDRILMRYDKFGYAFLAWHLKSTAEFVGQCGLLPQEVEGALEMEVGYLFLRTHWHRGYATEAARASRDYGFTHFNPPHIISLINPENSASIRVAERNGMSFDRMAYCYEFWHAVYKITRAEWEQL